MARVHHRHHNTPLWLQAWHVFALSASTIGLLLLLALLAAIAISG